MIMDVRKIPDAQMLVCFVAGDGESLRVVRARSPVTLSPSELCKSGHFSCCILCTKRRLSRLWYVHNLSCVNARVFFCL